MIPGDSVCTVLLFFIQYSWSKKIIVANIIASFPPNTNLLTAPNRRSMKKKKIGVSKFQNIAKEQYLWLVISSTQVMWKIKVYCFLIFRPTIHYLNIKKYSTCFTILTHYFLVLSRRKKEKGFVSAKQHKLYHEI